MLPRLKIYASKARLRELKAEMLEARLAAQEEKLDVAVAMGWYDEDEEEADEHTKCVLSWVVDVKQQTWWGEGGGQTTERSGASRSWCLGCVRQAGALSGGMLGW